MEKIKEAETITYWESRRVNIGQYESVDFGLSYTSRVRHINQVDKTLELRAKEIIEIDAEKEDFSKSVTKAVNRVKNVLDKRETYVRSVMAAFEDEEMLDNIAKLQAQGLKPTEIKVEKVLGKRLTDNDGFDVDEDEIKDET